jgi:glycosyltransferase involved in cell wall biosynthesis
MGSDVLMSKWMRVLTRFFYYYKWDLTIVKTEQMKELLNIGRAHIIQNGVDINRFKPIPKSIARRYINYPEEKKIILFIAILNRPEKNKELAEKAAKELNNNGIELKHIYNVPNSEIPFYLNAADTLLLTSKWEGSVNVIKEAMACNCPVVTTNVGDVNWVIGNTEGCYITSFEAEDVAQKIKAALSYGKRTNGRQRIIELGLDSESVANKIVALYEEVISDR